MLNKIINHYGHEHQLNKAVEEMAELTQVISRRLQSGEWDKIALFEELADVYVTLEQLQIIFCKEYEASVDGFKDILKDDAMIKIKRTLGRMHG